MLLRLYLPFLLSLVLCITAQSQKKECRLKPKRFPSAFTHMTSDFAELNLQADVLPKKFFQIESGLMATMVLNQGQTSFGYSSNLLRLGLGKRLEIRTSFAIAGSNIQKAYPEFETINNPIGAGLKLNIMSESSTTPGLAVLAEYTYLVNQSAYQIILVTDKWLARILKVSLAAGPQLTSSSTSIIAYSVGLIVKEREQKVGLYAMASNRLFYLKNIANFGVMLTDNLNYQFTAGFGIHESEGLILVSYSGLFNYRHIRRSIASYF